MKNFLVVMLFLLVGGVGSAHAQSGLYVNKLYENEVRAVRTYIRGNKVKKYNLTLFHSLRMDVSDEKYSKIVVLVKKDAASAIDQEIETENGRLVYAMLSFAKVKNNNRYLCFQSQRNADGKNEVTLVYMEGEATMEKLKEIFK